MARIVLVPGFTQTASSWLPVARILQPGHHVRALEVPLRDSFAETAHAVGEAGGEAVYVGYSMGARLGLQLALDRPEVVRAFVCVSGTAGIADADERAARVASDEALAQSIERDGVDAFLERWLAQPMFAGVPDDAPGLADRRRLTPEFLAACLRVLGTGTMEPLWTRLGELQAPIALVTGTRDVKFDEIAEQVLGRITAPASHIRLAGGHALPLETPEVLAGFVHAFASQHG